MHEELVYYFLNKMSCGLHVLLLVMYARYMLWFNFICGSIFFKLVFFFQTGLFFLNRFLFFFNQFIFSKQLFFIEDIKQDHYLGVRTDVTFKTLNTDFQWLAFM